MKKGQLPCGPPPHSKRDIEVDSSLASSVTETAMNIHDTLADPRAFQKFKAEHPHLAMLWERVKPNIPDLIGSVVKLIELGDNYRHSQNCKR